MRHARPDREEPPVSAQDAATYQDFIDSRQF